MERHIIQVVQNMSFYQYQAILLNNGKCDMRLDIKDQNLYGASNVQTGFALKSRLPINVVYISSGYPSILILTENGKLFEFFLAPALFELSKPDEVNLPLKPDEKITFLKCTSFGNVVAVKSGEKYKIFTWHLVEVPPTWDLTEPKLFIEIDVNPIDIHIFKDDNFTICYLDENGQRAFQFFLDRPLF